MDPPPHRVRAGEVALWRDVCLRGTGFPARMLLAMAAERSVPLIDAALDEEQRGGPPAGAAPALAAAFAEDWRRAGAYLREVAAAPRFREALLWQNRGALHRGVASLLRRPAGAMDKRTREHERMVASYLQRYCAKNDTIGFFGPVGWATLDEGLASARVAPGRALLERRTVYFEHWAIDALATRLSEERALQLALAPRRMPTVRIEGELLHHPVDRSTRLPPGTARLIQACDGARSARAIAEGLAGDPALELSSVDEIYELLDELVEARVVLWRLEVPTAGFAPERALAAALAAAEPGPAREAAEAALAELEAARDRVAAAAGDPDALDVALEALADTFVRATGGPAERGAGQTYAGRGIIFEDCRRDLEVVLGRPFLDRIGPPLALIRASARWYGHAVAARFREVFARIYREVVAETGAPEVDLIRYYLALRPHLVSEDGQPLPTVREVRAELQRRWAELLAAPAGSRRVERRAAELAPRVAAAFAAPGPGWPLARHTSPDLMIAAAGPEALARGDFLVVLGEVHAGLNTITIPSLAKEHAEPARLHRARREETGRGVGWVEARGRVHLASVYSLAEDDLDVERGDARSHRPRAQALDVAGFVVIERDGQLWARRRDGSLELELVAFLEKDLMNESYGFELFAPAAHRPRITIDGFVLAREQWRFEAGELDFTRRATPLERFIGARRWARAHELPRFAFARSPGEPKPMYLDLESPVYVEIFCKLARAGGPIAVTEMLPAFDQLWLVDAEGAAYCSELRMAMVDDVAWAAPRAAP